MHHIPARRVVRERRAEPVRQYKALEVLIPRFRVNGHTGNDKRESISHLDARTVDAADYDHHQVRPLCE
jgi:hypothetical protein